jgi:hypothetical protein
MSGFLTDNDGPYIESDPTDIRDYQVDWTNVLDPSDTIATSTWEVPVGLTGTTDGISGKITSKRISGGRVSTVHRIFNTIVTGNGKRYKRSFRIFVKTNL